MDKIMGDISKLLSKHLKSSKQNKNLRFKSTKNQS